MCIPSSSIMEISWPFPKRCYYCLACFRLLLFSMASMICFSSCLRMSSFIFRQIALQISEYSMLFIDVPFLFICLRFSLSCLVLVGTGFSLLYLPTAEMATSWIIFTVVSPPRVKIVWWNWCEHCKSILDFDLEFSPMMSQLTRIYLFWWDDHFCSLKLGVNPCFFSHHAMITTCVETVDDRPVTVYVIDMNLS